MAGEIVQGALIEDTMNQTAGIGHGVAHPRGDGGHLPHLHQTGEDGIHEKRSGARAGGQARRGRLVISSRMTAKVLHVRVGKLPTLQDPDTLQPQIPTNARSGVRADLVLHEIIRPNRETRTVDRSTLPNNPQSALRIHRRAR